jgi:hypothetical protein
MVINSQRVTAATAADIDGRCRDNALRDRPDMVVFSGVKRPCDHEVARAQERCNRDHYRFVMTYGGDKIHLPDCQIISNSLDRVHQRSKDGAIPEPPTMHPLTALVRERSDQSV